MEPKYIVKRSWNISVILFLVFSLVAIWECKWWFNVVLTVYPLLSLSHIYPCHPYPNLLGQLKNWEPMFILLQFLPQQPYGRPCFSSSWSYWGTYFSNAIRQRPLWASSLESYWLLHNKTYFLQWRYGDLPLGQLVSIMFSPFLPFACSSFTLFLEVYWVTTRTVSLNRRYLVCRCTCHSVEVPFLVDFKIG